MSRKMKCLDCGYEIITSYNRPFPVLCDMCCAPMMPEPQDKVYHPPKIKYKKRTKAELIRVLMEKKA